MAIAPPPSLNGRPRKQLSDQLDRLDEVINGLEECLPAAVADAARAGIRRAITDVITDLTADPATLRTLRTLLAADTSPASRPSPWARLKALVRSAAAKAAHAIGMATLATRLATHALVASVRTRCTAAKASLARWTLLTLPVKSILSVSLSVGLLVAVVALTTPPLVAATLSGLGAAVTTASLQIGYWFRRQRAAFGVI